MERQDRLRIFRAYSDCLFYRFFVRKTLLYYGWFTVVGALVASSGIPLIPAFINVTLVIMAISNCIYMLNDVKDLEMDKTNPRRLNEPLPSGRVSVEEALSLSLISGIIGLSLAFFTSPVTFLLSIVYVVLGILYSTEPIRLKRRFLLKEGTLATGLFISFLIGGSVAGTIPLSVILAASITCSYLFAVYPAFHDERDIREDRIYGCKTLANVLSLKAKMELAIVILIGIMTVTSLTYVNLGLNVFTPIVVCAACLLFLRFLFPLLIFEDRTQELLRAKRLYRLLGLTIQASFIVGSLSF